MLIRNTRDTWGAVSKVLHWFMALAIFTMMGLGLLMVDYAHLPTRFQMYFYHKSLGILILAMVLLRLLWRLVNPSPSLPETTKPYERWLAHGAHVLLYLLMLAVPLSGWLISSASGFGLQVFGLFKLPEIAAADKDLQTLAETIHYWLFWSLVALLLLHVAAALKHHWILKDNVLRRMLPGNRRGEE